MASTDLAIQEDGGSVTLFGTDNPVEVLARAAPVARVLSDLVRRQRLIVRIGQSEHVLVEGWTTLGSMLGVFPIIEWTRPVLEGEQRVGWEARAVARTRSGETIGAAEAECMRSERTWANRDDYALRSMAQTRAVSKALRLPLGFVMQLAGFDPTPADEMPGVIEHSAGGPQAAVTAARAEAEDAVVAQASVPQPASPAEPATDAQKKKLNVLVGTLRDKAYITTAEVYRYAYRDYPGIEEIDAAGELHWSPLRDTLSKPEASALIEALTGIEEMYALSVELMAAVPADRGEETRLAVVKNREAHGTDLAAHLSWLRAQVARASSSAGLAGTEGDTE